jgi:hypothetical protein
MISWQSIRQKVTRLRKWQWGPRNELIDGNRNRCQILRAEIGFWFKKVVDGVYLHAKRWIENENKYSISQRKSSERSRRRPIEIQRIYSVIYMGLIALPIVIRDLNARTIGVRFEDRPGYFSLVGRLSAMFAIGDAASERDLWYSSYRSDVDWFIIAIAIAMSYIPRSLQPHALWLFQGVIELNELDHLKLWESRNVKIKVVIPEN